MQINMTKGYNRGSFVILVARYFLAVRREGIEGKVGLVSSGRKGGELAYLNNNIGGWEF